MIAEKILKIMEEVGPVQQLNSGEYGVEKAIAVIHPLLVKYKVMILPKKILNFTTANSNKNVNIGMIYQFIDIETQDKESIEVEILGGGYDETGVKTIYNALSGAYRYALQQVFAFTVKEKEEGNNEQNESNKEKVQSQINMENINEATPEDLEELFKFDSEVA